MARRKQKIVLQISEAGTKEIANSHSSRGERGDAEKQPNSHSLTETRRHGEKRPSQNTQQPIARGGTAEHRWSSHPGGCGWIVAGGWPGLFSGQPPEKTTYEIAPRQGCGEYWPTDSSGTPAGVHIILTSTGGTGQKQPPGTPGYYPPTPSGVGRPYSQKNSLWQEEVGF